MSLLQRCQRLPEECQALDQWLNWGWQERVNERTGEKKRTKVPLIADGSGRLASSTDRTTWRSFPQAVEASARADGIGFVFTREAGIVGIDLDRCIEDVYSETVDEWALEWVQRFGSYTEVSPSGTGLHILVRGKLPEHCWNQKPQPIEGEEARKVEVYEHGRFFCMTGQPLPGAPSGLTDASDMLIAFQASYGPKHKDPAGKEATRFRTLFWLGETAAYDGDHSRADLALMADLAYWSANDKVTMERLFSQSALFRPEKLERSPTYLELTMERALSGKEEEAKPAGESPGAAAAPDTGGRRPGGTAGWAREWADENFGRFRFVEGDSWREYFGSAWADIPDTAVNTRIQHWLSEREDRLGQALSHRFVTEIRHLSEAWLGDGERPLPRERFDPDRELLPVTNGILDVRTGELKPHGPEYLNSYALPYPYDPEARCPRFEQFLTEAMIHVDGSPCPEWVSLLQEWMGYCLIPDSRAELILVNCGQAGAGKSTFTKVLGHLVGQRQTVALDLKQLAGYHPDYVLAHLVDKLIAEINEPRPRDLADCAQTLYALCSGDKQQARQPAKPEFDFAPRCRLVMNCNQIPDSKDLTQALYRRMGPVEWRRARRGEFEEDKDFLAKLLEELPGVLNFALVGLARVRERGWRIEIPDESVRLKREYQFDQDTVRQFLEECPVADPNRRDVSTPAAQFYQAYAAWCKRAGQSALSSTQCSRHLTKGLGYPETVPQREGGEVVKVRFGIQLPFRSASHDFELSE